MSETNCNTMAVQVNQPSTFFIQPSQKTPAEDLLEQGFSFAPERYREWLGEIHVRNLFG